MPILISFQEKKRRKYLIIIIVVAVLGIVTFLIYKHLSQEEISSPVTVAPKKEVKINFELFKNPTLVNLQPFEEITLPSPEAEAVSLNPTLSWQSVPEAEIYLWEVVGVESGNTKETSATVSKRLEPSATYIWRVKACKEDMSECSLWSNNCQNGNELNCWRFNTIKRPSLILTFPSPEADAVFLNLTLSWQSVPEAEIYLWEVVGVESGNTKETSATVSKRLEPSATYIWRVKACKEDMSECSLWSSRTFTTSPAFISPGLISPPMKEIFIKGREDPFKPY